MKTIKISAFILATIVSGLLFIQPAEAKKPATDKPAYVVQLNKIVTQSVQYPDFSLTKDERGDITVTFSLTDDGKITVEKVVAPSERIEKHVKDQLQDVSCKDVIRPYGQKYTVKFRFQNS